MWADYLLLIIEKDLFKRLGKMGQFNNSLSINWKKTVEFSKVSIDQLILPFSCSRITSTNDEY